MAIERIFVPVDFSKYSEQALALALEIAKGVGAHLEVFHCYDEVRSGKAPVGSAGLDPAIRANAEEDMKQLLARFQSKAEGVDVELNLHPGMFPKAAVLARAEETNPDLIVLGTHGHTGLMQALLGSVAEELVRKAPCPVLTVRAS